MRYRFNIPDIARYALLIFCLSALSPALGAPGVWVCPTGQRCALMRGSSLSRMPDEQPVHHACNMPESGDLRIESPESCSFVPAMPSSGINRVDKVKWSAASVDTPLLRPVPLEEWLPALLATRPDYLPPSDNAPPPFPYLSNTPSRAPPLA